MLVTEPDEGEVAELGIVKPALPGISAAKYREELRSALLVIVIPAIVFGFVLNLWGPWLTSLLLGMGLAVAGLATVKRAQRVNAVHRWERGELP